MGSCLCLLYRLYRVQRCRGPDQPLVPSLRTEQNPDGPGAFVARFVSGEFFWILADGVNTSYIGYTAEELATACTSEQLAGLVEVHRVDRPNGGFSETNKAKEIGVAVWALADPTKVFEENVCLILEDPLVASGTGRYLATFKEGGPGLLFASVLRATGTLADAQTGAPLHYVAGFRFVVLKDGTEKLLNNFIRLTPIGP